MKGLTLFRERFKSLSFSFWGNLKAPLLYLSLFFMYGSFSFGQDNGPVSKSKPNIILIFTDQQNSMAMSAAGNPYLNTPAMDMLATNGVRFTESYSASPVCGPARSSIITGLMPHQTGVEWNGQGIKESVTNSGEIFRKNGYQTIWAGKWHLPESYPQQASAKNKETKGFDVLPFWNPEKEHWMLGSEADPPLTTAVVDFLEHYDKKKPLFMAISYHNPHDINFYSRKKGWVSQGDSTLEIRHYGFKYKLPKIIGTDPHNLSNLPPLPVNHEIEKGEPRFIKEKREHHNEYGLETKLANAEFGDIEWQGYLNAYYKLTEMVDAEIDKVLKSLKENGYWDNTLIVFTSDHGDGAAAHKWASKLSFYEESSKIPMIVVWPGLKNKGLIDRDHLVSQIDILPTMLDYANVHSDISFAGKSLKPIMEGERGKWRNYVVTELADYAKEHSRKGRMLRTGPYKYNIYSTGEEQLFNLGMDGGEMQNLANEPRLSHIKKICQEYLLEWAKETNDTFVMDILSSR